jgi:Glycosyl hydrolases family 43
MNHPLLPNLAIVRGRPGRRPGNPRFAAAMALALGFAALAPSVRATPSNIVNNSVWNDTSGHEIEAQGGFIVNFGGTYYWYGTDLSTQPTNNINLYTSTDLVNWTSQGAVADLSSIPGYTTPSWVGRTKVAYNASTGKYVMFMEYSDGTGGGRNHLVFLTSSSPTGSFTYQNSDAYPGGYAMGDLGMFFSDSSGAYLIFVSDTSDVDSSLTVAKLSSDYLSISSVVSQLTSVYREAPCLFSYGGLYYIMASDLAGWDSSGTSVWWASSLSGPWTSGGYISTSPSSSNSFDNQVDQILPVSGSAGTTYVFLGDRWSDEGGSSGLGQNNLYPLTFDSYGWPTLNGEASWNLDLSTGSWTTNLTANPGFETGDLTGWSTWTNTSGSIYVQGGGRHGAYELTCWASSAYQATCYQSPSLANGTYTFLAWVEGDPGFNDCGLIAKDYDSYGDYLESECTLDGTWEPVMISGIGVTAGTCTYGLWADANANDWCSMDDADFYAN